MKAKLTQAWSCAPEGHTVLRFNANDIIEGSIAVMAIDAGVAIEHKEIEPLETKIETPKKKTKKG
jgi:hypothetical protein